MPILQQDIPGIHQPIPSSLEGNSLPWEADGTQNLIGHLLSEMVLDLDADKDVTIVGGKVSKWVSQKGGHVASQGTSTNQPTYTATNTSFRGHATVDVDPTTAAQWLTIPNHADLQNRDGWQLWLVGDFVGQNAYAIYKSGSLEWDLRPLSSGWIARVNGVSGVYSATGGIPSGAGIIRLRFRDGELRCRHNGTEGVDTIQSGVVTSTSSVGIGASSTGLFSASGAFTRILRINRWLSDSENNAIDTYLTNLYGVSV